VWTDRIVAAMAAPGKKASHAALRRYGRAAFSIDPHSGREMSPERPRKVSVVIAAKAQA